jgi:hypothetical protein
MLRAVAMVGLSVVLTSAGGGQRSTTVFTTEGQY